MTTYHEKLDLGADSATMYYSFGTGFRWALANALNEGDIVVTASYMAKNSPYTHHAERLRLHTPGFFKASVIDDIAAGTYRPVSRLVFDYALPNPKTLLAEALYVAAGMGMQILIPHHHTNSKHWRVTFDEIQWLHQPRIFRCFDYRRMAFRPRGQWPCPTT